MVRVPGGHVVMGSERFYPEEAPVRIVEVAPFLMDSTPVTNAAFGRFVDETRYVTVAEIAPDPADYPGIADALIRPGSLTFVPPSEPVDLQSGASWWQYRIGTDWRHPAGPGSSIVGLEEHPVVHVAFADALAYAAWAGKCLPTEAEWEWAARGGLEGKDYAWGDELTPGDRIMANYWQGSFPLNDLAIDGWAGTSPARFYPANGFGLYDMIGNVWEWTADAWSIAGECRTEKETCCVPGTARDRGLAGNGESASVAPKAMVLKGGSHLCAENYCRRYRPAARIAQTIDSAASHIGFRCIKRI